jgi:hypothetical protein
MRHPNQHKHNKSTDPQHHKNKQATFTFSGKETKKITKLYKTQIKVAFRTRNTTQNIIKPHPQIERKKVAFTK